MGTGCEWQYFADSAFFGLNFNCLQYSYLFAAAWFDVTFKGSAVVAVLPTGPASPGTHWYQCRLLLRSPLALNAGQRVTGVLRMVANERWSYNLSLVLTLPGSEHTSSDGTLVQESASAGLQDQLYYYMSTPSAT